MSLIGSDDSKPSPLPTGEVSFPIAREHHSPAASAVTCLASEAPHCRCAPSNRAVLSYRQTGNLRACSFFSVPRRLRVRYFLGIEIDDRIGDHCTNIAEAVTYIVTGQTIPDERPRHGALAAEAV
jgi:hypothetical protein